MEDNEILMAFETQKRIIRHLENELQEEKASSQRKIQKEREEVERLRADNDRQQKVLAGAKRTDKSHNKATTSKEKATTSKEKATIVEVQVSPRKSALKNKIRIEPMRT